MPNKVLSFIWYFFSEPFKEMWGELKDIWNVITKKKTWILILGVITVISLFLKNKTNFMFFFFCFCLFFIIYQWQKYHDIYIHQQREKAGYANILKKKGEKKDGQSGQS